MIDLQSWPLRSGGVFRWWSAVVILGRWLRLGKTGARLLFCLLTSNILISSPIRQRHVLPSMQINAGVDMAIDPSSEDVEQVLKDATGGLGVDVAIETSAVYQALEQAIRGLAFNGTTAVAHFNIPNL